MWGLFENTLPIFISLLICFAIYLSFIGRDSSWIANWFLNKTSRLCSAVSVGDHLEAATVLRSGADPNVCTSWKFQESWGGLHKQVPILTVAVDKGDEEVVAALLEAKVDTENRGDFRVAPLTWAVGRGRTSIVKKLLKYGADMNSQDLINGNYPIHYAAFNGSIKLAQILKDHGASLDVTNKYGNTPLHDSAWLGRIAIVDWLIDHGIDTSIVNKHGETAADKCETPPQGIDTDGHKGLAVYLRGRMRKQAAAAKVMSLKIPVKSISNTQTQPGKKVFIMNFIMFPKDLFENREGAFKDSENLQSTFEKLGYQVILREDMSAGETDIFLCEIQQDISLDFLLLFVLSHGVNDTTFCTSDGAQYPMEDLYYRFTDSKCPQLRGRSKIILSNFCRGQNVERISHDAGIPKDEVPHNMITIYSSHEGFRAKRSHEIGTIFVHNICKVLNENPTVSIQVLFNEIYAKMALNGQTPQMKVSAPYTDFTF